MNWQNSIDSFCEVNVSRDDKRVSIEYIGEGCCGDFDCDDPEDKPLLRFSCSNVEDGEWVEMHNGSYCTCLPVSTPHKDLETFANRIMDILCGDPTKVKYALQEITWTDSI